MFGMKLYKNVVFDTVFTMKHFAGRQLMNLGFLQEKTNPGGFGSLTALSGKTAETFHHLQR